MTVLSAHIWKGRLPLREASQAAKKTAHNHRDQHQERTNVLPAKTAGAQAGASEASYNPRWTAWRKKHQVRRPERVAADTRR